MNVAIGEAMLAIVLTNAMLEKFGGDSLEETKRNYTAYIRNMPLKRGVQNGG
ncbi:MAG: Chorismate synthase [Dehalococcoidia bacterium]|nr:Chorismate synthase [Dehalococcoidia bacterium]